MTDFSQHFDIDHNVTYLNTPGNGLLPRSVKEWRANFERTFYDSGSMQRDRQGDFMDLVKDQVAKFFDSPVENTFLTPNFSFAFTSLINQLPADFSYLLLEDEYPSLAYPLTARRLQCLSVSVNSKIEDEILQAVERHRPDVFVLSLVQYISGLKIDLNFLKQLKSQYPSLIILADGTQFLGTAAFSFRNSGIDALAASGYKWLLSGFGNGFLLLSEELRDRLEADLSDIPAPVAPMWKGKTTLNTLFEPGHQDNIAHGTLRESLRFLHSIGLDNIEQHLRLVSEQAYTMLADRGLLLPYIRERQTRSPLINIQVDTSIYPRLLEQGIMCYPRGNGIRIGIHLYNTISDIEKLVELIEKHNEI